MAALLEKVCAGTRDVLWRWPYFGWWIHKIKLFFGTSLFTLLSDQVCSAAIQVSCSTLCFCTSPLFLVLYVLQSDTKSYTLPLESASQAVIRDIQVIRLCLRSG
jgi:hypothetical protein